MGELFRHTHTLKSVSRTLGLQKIGELAQSMERFFKKARNAEPADTIDNIPLLFDEVEACEKLLDGEESIDVEALIARMDRSMKHGK